jgi:hypothetical protein
VTPQTQAIVQECKIQADSCRYSAAALYEWLAEASFRNRLWNALPIALGALAGYGVLSNDFPIFASFLAMLAGLLPSISEKLELKAHTDEILTQAGQYKNLENRFKQAASITELDDDPEALRVEFGAIMRMAEDIRARPLVIPEKHFQAGRAKVKDGRYEPDVETLA